MAKDRLDLLLDKTFKEGRGHKSTDKNFKKELRKHSSKWYDIKDFHETTLYGRGRDETTERKPIYNATSDSFIKSQIKGQIYNYEKETGSKATAATVRRFAKQQIERNIQRRFHHQENILNLLKEDKKTLNEFKRLVGIKSIKEIDLGSFKISDDGKAWYYETRDSYLLVKITISPVTVILMNPLTI